MDMTENEKKKEFLNSYLRAKQDVLRLEEQLEELRESKMSLSMANDGMPHGSSKSDLSDYAAKVDELERKITAKRYQRIQTLQNVQNAIEDMEDGQEKLLLTYRYIKGLKWEEIAVRMNYSWQHTHKIHANALKHFKHAIECDIVPMV